MATKKIPLEFFPNGEIKVRLKPETLEFDGVVAKFDRGESVNDQLMSLFLWLDAHWRATRKEISLYLPYIPYLRQDRSDGFEPLSAKVIFQILETLHVKEIETIEPHFKQVQGFTNIPMKIRWLEDILPEYKDKLGITKDTILVAPDEGRRKTVEHLAKKLGVESYVIPKERTKEGQIIRGTINLPKNKELIIIDDILDTGGTMLSIVKDIPNPTKIVVAHALHTKNFTEQLPSNIELWACDTIENEKLTNILEIREVL